MSEIWSPKVKQKIPWLCLWQDKEGKYIINASGEFLCFQTMNKGDKTVEFKMGQAAKSLGVHGGHPVWRRGRQVTSMEHDDQMERMIEGKIPDPVEEYMIEENGDG